MVWSCWMQRFRTSWQAGLTLTSRLSLPAGDARSRLIFGSNVCFEYFRANDESYPRDRNGQTSPFRQFPESILAPVLLLQSRQELSVVREPAELLHRRSAGLAFRQVTCGVAVAFGFASVERVCDHGAAQQSCGKRVVGFKRIGGGCQGFVGVAVQVLRTGYHQLCKAA